MVLVANRYWWARPQKHEDLQVDNDELAANWKHRLTPGAIRL